MRNNTKKPIARRSQPRRAFPARLAAVLFALCICATLCCSCAIKREKKYTATSLAYFDTYSEITLYTSDTATLDAFAGIVWGELEICHRLFDIYHEYDGMTNLCTVNRTAGVSPVSVDSRIMELLEFSKQMYTRTDGKTNIALGSVLEIWHAYREEGTAVPTKAELQTAAAHTDIDDLILDPAAGTVYFADPWLKLDVGAVAKGYAAGRVYDALIAAGYTDFFLNIGGSILCAGTKPDGSLWRVGVEMPDGSGYAATVTMTDRVLVTSGDYQRYYEVDGVRYCHIIDSETLFPAREVSAVTVYARDAALADALSTALFCMSYEEGTQFLSRFENCEALWILPDGTVQKSDGFAQFP